MQEGSDSQKQASMGSDQVQSSFTIGQASKAEPEPSQGSKAQQLEEKRKNEIFALDPHGVKSKRNRIEFAEKLRKERREDFMRQKRQNMGATAKSSKQDQPSIQEMQMDQVTDSTNVPLKQIISIDQALASFQRDAGQFAANKEMIEFDMTEMPRIFDLVRDQQSDTNRFVGSFALKKLLSRPENPPYVQVMQANLIPILLQYAARIDCKELQLEAIWALTNMASDEGNGVVQALVDCQILPLLKSLLSQPGVSEEIIEQVIWCYGNISGENEQLRDTILADGVVEPMCQALDRTEANSNAIRNIAWCLSNLHKGEQKPQFDLVAPSVPCLARALMRTELDTVINDITWAMSFFTQEGTLESLQCLINTGAVPRFTQLIHHPSMQIAVPALRVVGNVLSSSQSAVAQVAINAGIIELFSKMIDHQKPVMRKEVAWSLANVLAESAERVQQCLDAGIVQSLILHLQHDVNNVRKECVWALTNALCRATPQQTEAIVRQGFFTACNYALELPDSRIMFVALEGISYALKNGSDLPLIDGEHAFVLQVEKCGLLDKLEDLQEHENKQVFDKTSELLQNYFADEADLDDQLQFVDDVGESLPLAGQANQSAGISYEQLFNV